MSDTLWLIVPAAGRGLRAGGDRPKQYQTIAARPVLAHTLTRLHDAFPDAQLVLCLDPDDGWFDPDWVPFSRWQRVSGGRERRDSVQNALNVMGAGADDIVMVHDVARPCVSVEDLHAIYQAALAHSDGALLAMPVADTMKREAQGLSDKTEPRVGLWHALTPQGFRFALLKRALDQAVEHGVTVTDEASAVEALGRSPKLVSGRRDNLKITHPDDLALAAAILALQAGNSEE